MKRLRMLYSMTRSIMGMPASSLVPYPVRELRAGPFAPTGLVPVERRLLHYISHNSLFAPTGLVPVERRLLHYISHNSLFAHTGLVPVERRLLHYALIS